MPRKHVVISGVGAAGEGLLLAFALLSAEKGAEFRIDIIEARSRAEMYAPKRAWAVPLGARGRAALQSCDGGQLWAAVAPHCASVSRLVEHAPDGTASSRELPAPVPVVAAPALLAAMLSKLDERLHALRASGRMPMVSLRFQTRVVAVELNERVVRLASPATSADAPPERSALAYDVLIGADGADSVVRAALQARTGVNFKQQWVEGAAKTVRVATSELPMLDAAAAHLLFPRLAEGPSGEQAAPPSEAVATVSSRGALAAALSPRASLRELWAELTTRTDAVVLVTPVQGGTTLLTVAWPPDAPPDDLLRLTAVADVRAWFARHFPLLAAAFGDDAAAAFLAQRPAYARAIHLNTYHDPATRAAVVIGDAAHAPAPGAGQAAAAALADAALLAQLLSETPDARDALTAFSAVAVKQGQAMVRLSSSLPALAPLTFAPWARALERGRDALAGALGASKQGLLHKTVTSVPGGGALVALAQRALGRGGLVGPLFGSEEPYDSLERRHRAFVAAAMLINRFRDGAVF